MAKRNLKLDTPDNIRKALAKVANMTYKGEIDTMIISHREHRS